MTSSVPAGAGGVDREAIRRDIRCKCGHRAVDHQDGGTGRCTEDNDRDWYCPCQAFEVADETIPTLLAALVAAEQRADTAEAANAAAMERAEKLANDSEEAVLRWAGRYIRAALSSRPVQPESEQR